MLIKGIFFLGKFLGRQENAIRGIVLGTSRSMGGWVLEPKSSFARRTPGGGRPHRRAVVLQKHFTKQHRSPGGVRVVGELLLWYASSFCSDFLLRLCDLAVRSDCFHAVQLCAHFLRGSGAGSRCRQVGSAVQRKKSASFRSFCGRPTKRLFAGSVCGRAIPVGLSFRKRRHWP